MKKIFFDCGSHLFQGFDSFVSICNIDENWECYSFEANPITYELSKSKYESLLNQGFKINHYNYAVLDKDDYVDVNCTIAHDYDGSVTGSYTGQGSNVLSNPPQGWNFTYDESKYKVKTIDFSKFLKENATPDDYVVVKMDIEGSEFPVIDKLILDNMMKYINVLYVEYHEKFFDDINFYSTKKENHIKIFDMAGSKIEPWF